MAHRTARLNGFGRQLLIDRVVGDGWTVSSAARAQGISRATGHKWVRRYRLEGRAGLADRSSRPHRSPSATAAHEVQRIVAARLEWRWGPDRLGPLLGLPVSTVAAVIRRAGLPRLADIDRPTGLPVRRYEVCHPGALVHQDHKKLGRIPDGGGHRTLGRANAPHSHRANLGYDHFEVIVDDRSRRSVVVQVARRERRQRSDGPGHRRWPCSPPRGSRRAGPDRQRPGLSLERLSGRPRRTAPQADPAVSTPDQRQGRAVHRDPGPRVGLRPPVPLERRATGGAPGLRRLLQSAPPAHRARRTLTHGRCQQRPWRSQLAAPGLAWPRPRRWWTNITTKLKKRLLVRPYSLELATRPRHGPKYHHHS